MNIDGVVMEFLKDGEPVALGERGEIACTSLVNYAMPFIRYLVDDQGVSMNEKCSCGRSLPLMKMLEGRKDDFLTSLDGRIISPRVFTHYTYGWPFGDLLEIRQFKVVQERRDKLVIKLVGARSPSDDKAQEYARKEIEKVFGEGIQVEFELVEKIDRDHGGKLRKIVSYVPAKWNT